MYHNLFAKYFPIDGHFGCFQFCFLVLLLLFGMIVSVYLKLRCKLFKGSTPWKEGGRRRSGQREKLTSCEDPIKLQPIQQGVLGIQVHCLLELPSTGLNLNLYNPLTQLSDEDHPSRGATLGEGAVCTGDTPHTKYKSLSGRNTGVWVSHLCAFHSTALYSY